MARFASITMSMRDIDRLKTIQAIIDGRQAVATYPAPGQSADTTVSQ